MPAASRPARAPVSRLDAIECASIYDVVESVKQYTGQLSDDSSKAPNFDYRACKRILCSERQRLEFGPVEHTLAIATVDPESEGQGRFVGALGQMEILVEPVDFRHATVTAPLSEDGFRNEKKYVTSLSPNVAYVVGLLAGRRSPEVVIVTRAFELFDPLSDFVTTRGGKAAIAFFRRFLDPRWGLNGLFDADSPIRFIDLDPHSEELLGFDVRKLTGAKTSRVKGISGI